MSTHTCDAPPLTGMAHGILAELAEKLTQFAETGEEHILSLRAMPMTQTDIDWLQSCLGTGEVQMQLAVAGQSEVFETTYPGIWWVRHYSGDDIAAEELHITTVPEIVRTHRADAAAAGRALTRFMQEEMKENPEGGRNG